MLAKHLIGTWTSIRFPHPQEDRAGRSGVETWFTFSAASSDGLPLRRQPFSNLWIGPLSSRMTGSLLRGVTLWTVACQALLSMGFPRQEYWSELPCSPGDLHDPETDPTSLAPPSLAGGFLTNVPPLEAPAEGLLHASPG